MAEAFSVHARRSVRLHDGLKRRSALSDTPLTVSSFHDEDEFDRVPRVSTSDTDEDWADRGGNATARRGSVCNSTTSNMSMDSVEISISVTDGDDSESSPTTPYSFGASHACIYFVVT